HCPVYTMFVMNADGGGIRALSFHETHEWQPSIDRDGLIIYTRWDYVDRDTNAAHHIWRCFPDGRDGRSFGGNYPVRRGSRPWMEMNVRAIPGSSRYVATAAAHHGHAFGSLMVIDLGVEDDGAMSQIRRLTPEAPMPEAEGKPTGKYMVYGTAWPLSEKYYLCAYAPDGGSHGLYLLDCFGNRELIYRDPAVSSLDPIPLRPRPRPPVISPAPPWTDEAPGTLLTAAGKARATAAAAVMNVYDGDFTWPTGTRITALRIIQLLPKSTAPPNRPRIGVANQTNARAVLGTVPVEADGSAYFRVPAGVPLYFQALDANGLAVQSMRSVTYFQPRSMLSCQGCHEPKRRSPAPGRAVPLALRRGPSDIRPAPDGARPFSYVRLVQPVLDRYCVGCHRREKALDLGGEPAGRYGWTRSYVNLAGKFGFYFNVSNGSIRQRVHGGSRTIPGRFGARAAPLMKYLAPAHHGVKLPPADMRRITLWLDCNSEFYGSYERTDAQSRGEVVPPSLE
ncbi:MAG: hypothetical protein J7M21_05240, partial [Planctomycetes bacterium]|nr:hypothetical protein [Planctomycetota bacterium]